MANKKMLPREIKLKEKVEGLQAQVEMQDVSLKLAEANLQNAYQQIKYSHKMMREMSERLKELEDFQAFARLALPHLEPKREMMAVNTSNRNS